MPLEIISLRTIATSISSQPIIKQEKINLSIIHKNSKKEKHILWKDIFRHSSFQRNNLPKNFKKMAR